MPKATTTKKKSLTVYAYWDSDARVWWAESDDVPGLVTEARTFDALVKRVLAVLPELLELNGIAASTREMPVHVVAERTDKVRLLG